MQTFLPYSSFTESAKCLDNKRLGKQRVEAWQILNALQGKTKGWVNHPATKLWENHQTALIYYGLTISNEWQQRGFADSMGDRFEEQFNEIHFQMPWWVGYEPLHISHQSNLYRKNPIHYKQFADAPLNLPYIWCKVDGTFEVGGKPDVIIS